MESTLAPKESQSPSADGGKSTDEGHQKSYDCGESACCSSDTQEEKTRGKHAKEDKKDTTAETLNNLPQNLSKDYLQGYVEMKEQFETLHRECNQIFERLEFSYE